MKICQQPMTNGRLSFEGGSLKSGFVTGIELFVDGGRAQI
jgi:hypothetical protein